MLAARRRLLMMLLGLQVAAVALTLMGLVPLWILLPPTIMLAGYLLLLREAAHADAERASREAEVHAARSREEAARAREASRAQARERRAAPAPAPAAPAPPPEPAPEDYSDLGEARDYAPGLAGYETDSAVIDFAQYKRAVGD